MYGKGVVGGVVGASVPSAQLARSRGRNRKSCEYRRQLLSVNVETACVRAHARVPETTLHRVYVHCSSCTCTIIQLHRRLPAPSPHSSSPARPYLQCDSTIKPISISVIRVRSIFSTYVTSLSSCPDHPPYHLIHEIQPIQF